MQISGEGIIKRCCRSKTSINFCSLKSEQNVSFELEYIARKVERGSNRTLFKVTDLGLELDVEIRKTLNERSEIKFNMRV